MTDFTPGEELYLATRLYGTPTAWLVHYHGPSAIKGREHLVTVWKTAGTARKYADVDPNLLFKLRAEALVAARRMTR